VPVSKHRRQVKPPIGQPRSAPLASRRNIESLDALRQAVADPALDFPAKATVAGVWWFRQLLRKTGDRRRDIKISRKDETRAALLLCVAMDGEHGQNDDLAPVIADMLRPYATASSFAAAWEQAMGVPAGTVAIRVARLMNPSGGSAA
jgi:hypothetical protein